MTTVFRDFCDFCGDELARGRRLEAKVSFTVSDLATIPTVDREQICQKRLTLPGWQLLGVDQGDYCSWECALNKISLLHKYDTGHPQTRSEAQATAAKRADA